MNNMNAPDKIYISTLNIDKGDNYWFIEESYNTANKKYDVEYIRKDALLELAKKELENAEITDFDEFGRGEVIAYRRIVDKLNSM